MCVCPSILGILFNFLPAGSAVRMEVKDHNQGVENKTHRRTGWSGEECAMIENESKTKQQVLSSVGTNSVHLWLYRMDLDRKDSPSFYMLLCGKFFSCIFLIYCILPHLIPIPIIPIIPMFSYSRTTG